MHATADVVAGNITFTVRLAPGTFDPQTTVLIIGLDTDQDPSTGRSGTGIGEDYLVRMGGGNSNPNQAVILKYAGTASNFNMVASVPVSLVADGKDVTVPLLLLGNDDGRLNFRVAALTLLSTTTELIDDFMPDSGLSPGRVQ